MGACAPVPGRQYLWQTSSEGDDLYIVDIEHRETEARLFVGPDPHGIATPQDGSVVYVALEANGKERGEVIGVHPKDLRVVFRMEVGPEPHGLAVSPDGRWLYVACRDESFWVIDLARRAVASRVRTGGRPHNATISRDGRTAYLSDMEKAEVTVVDIEAGHRTVGGIQFSSPVRPAALSKDGLRLFQHVDGLNGFEVADTRRRGVVSTVRHEHELEGVLLRAKDGWLSVRGFQRCHGLAVRPDQAEVWSVCGRGVTVHSGEAPYGELAWIPLVDSGYWITFSLDSQYAFVAIRDERKVAMIEASTKKVVDYLPVGDTPKRNLVLVAPR